MSIEAWDFITTSATVLGAMGAAWLTAWLTRRSQKESSQITLLMGLIDQIQEERDKAAKDAKQIPLWRRYTGALRRQIYGLHDVPVEPDKELEL